MSAGDVKTRPYAGQCWAPATSGSNLRPGVALQIIAKDLADDARTLGLTTGVVELWENKQKLLKGFFAGDTSELAAEGWIRLATL